MPQFIFAIAGCFSLMAVVSSAMADSQIPVQSVLTRVLEEAEVPAREAGVLAKFSVREGEPGVRAGVLMAFDEILWHS